MRYVIPLLAACQFVPVPTSNDNPDGPVAHDAHPVDVIDAAPVTMCPPGYSSIGTLTSKYRVGSDVIAWDAAEAACEADGAAHLAVLTDMGEAMALAPVTGVQTWMGIDDRIANGVFRAVTSEVPFLPWMPGQPKDDPNNRCVVLHDDNANVGLIDPHKCGDAHPYICECDFRRADPNAY